MGFSWCVYSSSVKLLCFTILIVFLSGFVWVLLGPKGGGNGTDNNSSSDDDHHWTITTTSTVSNLHYTQSSSCLKTSNSLCRSKGGGGSGVGEGDKMKSAEDDDQHHSIRSSEMSSSPPDPPFTFLSFSPLAQPIPIDSVRSWKNFPVNVTTSTAGLEPVMAPTESIELRKVVATDLNRIETSLQHARAAIKEAQTGVPVQDPDYTPVGPMYWNANAFHRSYLEMEKRFKVYVYPDGEPPLFHNGPCKSIYSSEGNFIHQMELNHQFRTHNPNHAQAFFMPFSIAKLVQFVYPRDTRDFTPIRRTIRDYIKLISTNYPYWNRSLAADHFMLSCHDWGPEASFSVHELRDNAIRVLCNANTSEGFNPEKDVSFPEINLVTGHIAGFIGGPSPSQRPILAFFAGGLHGPIRPILLEHWENKSDGDIKVYRYLPRGVDYYGMLRKSKYCLCPSGYEVASPRIVESIYTGCVPVLINDGYVPPFSDVLNWKAFSVTVSKEDVPRLKEILEGISSRQYIRLQRRVVQIRRHFEVHDPPKRFDVFHMVLHSVWLRRLNVRIRGRQVM